jgi:hypothetical protein
VTSESHDESYKEVAFLPNLQYSGLLLPVVQMLYISISDGFGLLGSAKGKEV